MSEIRGPMCCTRCSPGWINDGTLCLTKCYSLGPIGVRSPEKTPESSPKSDSLEKLLQEGAEKLKDVMIGNPNGTKKWRTVNI